MSSSAARVRALIPDEAEPLEEAREVTQPPKLRIAPQPQVGPEDATRYLPFVRRIAARVARSLPPHVPMEDLVSAGMVGVLEALGRFDPSRGQRFESYAEFRVRGAILDELRRSDLMARDARLASKKLEKAIGDLAQELGRQPEEDELAQYLELSVEELRARLLKLGRVRVFYVEDLSHNDREAFELPSETESPFRQTAIREARRKLVESIPKLPPRLRTVLSLYYHEQMQLKEIAKIIGVSESRVSQILSESIHRLRSMIGAKED